MKFPVEIFSNKTSFDFVGKRYISFGFSILVMVFTLVLFLNKGFNLGIDFTGGVVMEIKTPKSENLNLFRETFSKMGYKGTSIQNVNDQNNIIIRFQTINDANQAKEIENIKDTIIAEITPDIEFRKIDYVGPKVGKELVTKGVKAIFFSLIGMTLYIGFRFNTSFSLAVVISLLHDAIATVGFYLLSHHEFDLTSIAAILTVIGYSINDKVVIFDRIRENLTKYKNPQLSSLVNQSINETLSRTTMTVLTTLLACLALVIFGGQVLNGFSMAMLFGIVFGTYSSIFIAAPLLLYTFKRQQNIK